jgi:hypothetical protein
MHIKSSNPPSPPERPVASSSPITCERPILPPTGRQMNNSSGPSGTGTGAKHLSPPTPTRGAPIRAMASHNNFSTQQVQPPHPRLQPPVVSNYNQQYTQQLQTPRQRIIYTNCQSMQRRLLRAQCLRLRLLLLITIRYNNNKIMAHCHNRGLLPLALHRFLPPNLHCLNLTFNFLHK